MNLVILTCVFEWNELVWVQVRAGAYVKIYQIQKEGPIDHSVLNAADKMISQKIHSVGRLNTQYNIDNKQ